MSSTVRFLDTMGQDPALARLAPAELEALMASLGVAADERRAVLGQDAGALARLAGGRTLMASLQFPGDNEPQPQDEPQRDDDLPDDQDDDGGKRSADLS